MVTKITESMDLSQALQTLKWLDEERRKDKATIAKLEERLKEQEQELARRATRLEELESSVARVEGVLSKVEGFEQMISNFKKEMTFQLEERGEGWRKERAEAKRLRRMEHDAMKEQLSQLEKELRVLPRYEDLLSARQTEQERMSEKIQTLEATLADQAKRIEDATNTVSYLEERRRSDHRRLTESERDITELNKKIESVGQKVPLFEQRLQKQQSRVEEAVQMVKSYDKPIVELRVSDFQRDQKVQSYLDQAEEVEEELERIREQTHGFLERREQVKRALSALEKFKTRIERRQDEMSERQRIAEERIERAWEEWETEQAKELRKRVTVAEQRWQAQEQTDSRQQRRLDAIEAVTELHRGQLGALWEAQRADADARLSAAQDMYEELVGPVDEQLAALRGE